MFSCGVGLYVPSGMGVSMALVEGVERDDDESVGSEAINGQYWVL